MTAQLCRQPAAPKKKKKGAAKTQEAYGTVALPDRNDGDHVEMGRVETGTGRDINEAETVPV